MSTKITKLIIGLVAASVLAAGFVQSSEAETFRDRLRARRAAMSGAQGQASDGQYIALTSDGIQRQFIVHVPPNLPANPSAVFVFHGSMGTGAHTEGSVGLDTQADREGFITVYPDGVNKEWTDGRIATQDGPNDVQFTRDMVAYLQKTYHVNTGRIFATGMSNGGIFDYKLACDAPGLIRAIAPVSANMAQQQVADCSRRPIPLMMFMGTADPLMPYDGGYPKLAKLIERTRGPLTDQMESSADTAAYWAKVDGCGASASKDLPDTVDDGTTVTQTDYADCRSGAVTLFSINEGGHAWPGTGKSGSRLTGKNTNDISANEEMVAFFKQFGL